MRRSLVLATAVLAWAGAPSGTLRPTPAQPSPMLPTELPRGVSPTHYAISIAPDAKALTFAAQVTIWLEVRQPTARITLNATDLKFVAATLSAANGATANKARIVVDRGMQTASFDFYHAIAPGSYRLALDYTGQIGTQAVGLFALDYDTSEGKQRALFTQFENSDARRMIPSWDEPAYKATFALQAVVPSAQMAVSNMPVTRVEQLPGGLSRISFAQTPRMSTYLLFLGLGDFERDWATVDGTELGVVARKGAAAQAAFALESSKALLREYNDYFGVRYPLPKLDNVAGPGRSQFFGAMENWGAIFTFERAILLDPTLSSQADRQRSFAVVAHEMAHQWFGDLVTMAWWDDLWLNEGFASWMETRSSARLHPEWDTALDAVDVREHAMANDSLASTHPVVQHVRTADEASQAFDTITYQKGESVIRMLEAYVGERTWRNGVRAYIQAHAYGNTVSDDLWASIEKAAKQPIMAIAHDFTLQPGVPLIRVGAAVCRNGSSTAALTQGEFSRDRPEKKPLRWRVPVVAQVAGNGKQARVLVRGGKGTLVVPGCGALVANAGQSGYYRTLYAPKDFAALATSFDKLAPIDQLGLLSDSWSLGMAGLQPASSFLDLARSASVSAAPRVWARIAQLFNNLNGLYGADAARQKRFASFAIERLGPVMAQVGWTARPGEPAPVANLRAELIETLGNLGDPATLGQARRLYAAMAQDPAALPGPLRKVVMAVVAQHADAATWNDLHAAARAEKSPLIKDHLYELLASSADPDLAERTLHLALTDEPGVTNSAAMVARVGRGHPDMAFDFAIANMARIRARLDSTSQQRYFARLASGSSDPAMVEKINAYAGANLAPSARREADLAVANINDRIRVRTRRLPEVDAWLARHAH